MNAKPFCLLIPLFLFGIWLLSSCSDIIEPSISKSTFTLQAPSNQYQSKSYTINFWWDQVNNALSYHLQVVTPNFASPGSLVLDTVIKKNTFSFNLNPGHYEWRVMAQNGSSQTAYMAALGFTVDASSIKQETVQLSSPANNLITNQSGLLFQWGSLYGATKYHFQIDTNNFSNDASVVSDQVIPGQQISFTFSKDHAYQWRVRAENDTAQSLWSAIHLITYDHSPPAKVMLASPSDNDTVALPVALQWTAVPTASKYKLYVYKNDGTSLYNQSFPVTVSSTLYSFNSGNSGDKIYWKVSALDAAGNEGEASDIRSFIVQ